MIITHPRVEKSLPVLGWGWSRKSFIRNFSAFILGRREFYILLYLFHIMKNYKFENLKYTLLVLSKCKSFFQDGITLIFYVFLHCYCRIRPVVPWRQNKATWTKVKYYAKVLLCGKKIKDEIWAVDYYETCMRIWDWICTDDID